MVASSGICCVISLKIRFSGINKSMKSLQIILLWAYFAPKLFQYTDGYKIQFPNITCIFENDKPVNSSTLLHNKSVVIKPGEATSVILLCEATYPIKWDFSGLFSPKIVNSFYTRRSLITNQFLLRLVLDLRNFSLVGSGISLKTTCKSTRDSEVNSDFYIFIKGNSNSTLIQPDENSVVGSLVIPCPTTDPTQDVQLYLRTDEGDEKLINETIATYNPIVGFVAKDNWFIGMYICRQNVSSVTINASSFHNNYFLSANVFSMEYLLSLLSKPKENDGNNHALRGYKTKYVGPPELYFDNNKYEIVCRSAVYPVMLQVVDCGSSMECDFLVDHCYKNYSLCDAGNRRTIILNGEMAYDEKTSVNESRVVLNYNKIFNGGRASCTADFNRRESPYFVSLEGKAYYKLDDVAELIRIYTEDSSTSFENTATRFVCEAIEYVIADGPLFQLEFRNGSKTYLDKIAENDVYSANEHTEVPMKHPKRFVSVVELEVPVDAIWLHCLASFWSPPKPIVISERLESKKIYPPTFLEKNADNVGHLNEVKYAGQKDFMLTCFAMGSPQPKYYWYANGSDALERFPLLTIGFDEDAVSVLKFPSVDTTTMKMYFGWVYECVALNSGGRAVKRFLVRSSDASISATQQCHPTTRIFALIVIIMNVFS